MALVKPLHSDDPDVMPFHEECCCRGLSSLLSLPLIEVLVPCFLSLIKSPHFNIKYIPVQVKISHDPQSKELVTLWLGG
jgi:hypothetical protein